MKVKVTDECIGCGLCETMCPNVFQIKEDKSVVVGDPDQDAVATEEAAGACPVNAIEIE